MKNYEKYADEIKKYSDLQVLCDEIKIPFILKPIGKSCARDIDCDTCQILTMLWLLEEYEEPKEPEIDWSKVEVDTPILVRDSEDENWHKRHFAKYKNGVIYTWDNGQTSWTKTYITTAWKYAKLAESEEKCEKPSKEETKEPETDWSKVKVDTPILVRQGEKGKWLRRHFAKYENGLVYAWKDSRTSWTANNMTTAWQCAKLAEDEETK